MLVHPRLKLGTPNLEAIFFRWTKLHFRDLLNGEYGESKCLQYEELER